MAKTLKNKMKLRRMLKKRSGKRQRLSKKRYTRKMMKGGGEEKKIIVKYSDEEPITAPLTKVDNMSAIKKGDIFEIKQINHNIMLNTSSNINGTNINKFNDIKRNLIDEQNIISGKKNVEHEKGVGKKDWENIKNLDAELKRINTKINYMNKYYLYYSYKILGIKNSDTTYIPLYNYTPSDVRNYSAYNHYATSYYVNTCGTDANDRTDLGIEELGNFSDIESLPISIRTYAPKINVSVYNHFDCKPT